MFEVVVAFTQQLTIMCSQVTLNIINSLTLGITNDNMASYGLHSTDNSSVKGAVHWYCL